MRKYQLNFSLSGNVSYPASRLFVKALLVYGGVRWSCFLVTQASSEVCRHRIPNMLWDCIQLTTQWQDWLTGLTCWRHHQYLQSLQMVWNHCFLLRKSLLSRVGRFAVLRRFLLRQIAVIKGALSATFLSGFWEAWKCSKSYEIHKIAFLIAKHTNTPGNGD